MKTSPTPLVIRPNRTLSNGWTITKHAAERMVEMDVSLADVEDVIDNWENRYQQRQFGEDCYCLQRGKLAIGTDDRNRRVLTVLWRRQDQWKR